MKLIKEDAILQKIVFDELHGLNINPNDFEFYLTGEGDKIYIIPTSQKPLKVILDEFFLRTKIEN